MEGRVRNHKIKGTERGKEIEMSSSSVVTALAHAPAHARCCTTAHRSARGTSRDPEREKPARVPAVSTERARHQRWGKGEEGGAGCGRAVGPKEE